MKMAMKATPTSTTLQTVTRTTAANRDKVRAI
jgi:hypothetical protein